MSGKQHRNEPLSCKEEAKYKGPQLQHQGSPKERDPPEDNVPIEVGGGDEDDGFEILQEERVSPSAKPATAHRQSEGDIGGFVPPIEGIDGLRTPASNDSSVGTGKNTTIKPRKVLRLRTLDFLARCREEGKS